MADFRKITDEFYAAPQISVSDIEEAARSGFKVLVMNRPDQETPDQPPLADITAAAEKNGMTFVFIPIAAPPTPADVQATEKMLNDHDGEKILAFCRSGTRSTTLWAYAVVASGKKTPTEALDLAMAGGYDLSGHLANLEYIGQ